MWPLLDRVRVPQGRERKWRSVLKGNMSVWCQPPPISTYLCSFLRSFITQVSPPVTPDFRTSHEATVWHAHVPETLIEADNCALRPLFYSINEYILFSSCVTTKNLWMLSLSSFCVVGLVLLLSGQWMLQMIHFIYSELKVLSLKIRLCVSLLTERLWWSTRQDAFSSCKPLLCWHVVICC